MARMKSTGSPALSPAPAEVDPILAVPDPNRGPSYDPTSWNVSSERKAAKYTPYSEDFGKIVQTMVVDDPMAAYSKLESELEVGESRTDHASVMRGLDKAETNARLAFRLYATAVRDARKWELDNQEVYGAMRAEALAALQAEKKCGERSKVIAAADVDEQAAIMFRDGWTSHQIRRLEVDQVVDSCKNLATLWESRARSLQTLASKVR